jgi:hypothetical protein
MAESTIKRYEPKTMPTKMKLQRIFYSSRCKPKENPELYVLSLEELCLQIDELYVGSSNQKMISNNQFIAIACVLNTLPEDYDHMVAQLT